VVAPAVVAVRGVARLVSAWEEGVGLELWGKPRPGGSFTRAEAEAWLAKGRRLCAEDYEKLLTQQGLLFSPGGEHREEVDGA